MTTVLAIHSGGFTSRQWKKLAQQLEPRYRVLTPDLIGYGADDRVPVGTHFHFSQDVAMLAALLSSGHEPAHLVGHSYGGFLAMQLALAHPERVRAIAVYEPVTFGLLDEPADVATRAAIDEILPYTPETAEAWLRGFIEWWQGAGVWDALPEPTKQAFRDVGWKVSEEVVSLSADHTDRARYATITAPTLVLGGAHTQPAELHVIQKLARVLPHATLELFPDLGHMGPITAAARVNDAIAAYLDAH